MIASVQDPGKMSNGLVVGDDKFILIRSDPGVALILKKGALGVVAYKSSQGKRYMIFISNPLTTGHTTKPTGFNFKSNLLRNKTPLAIRFVSFQ